MPVFTVISSRIGLPNIIIPSKVNPSNSKDTNIFNNDINKYQEGDYFYFYSPRRPLHNSMKLVHLYSSNNDIDRADFVSMNDFEEGFTRIASFFAFTNQTELYITEKLSISFNEDNFGLDIQIVNDKINDKDTDNDKHNYSSRKEILKLWVFTKPKFEKLYPLAAIIWPPAERYSNEISRLLKNNYKITKDIDFNVAPKRFLRFVNNIYKGDKRCDKSQLPGKVRNMRPYPIRMKYLRVLVAKADLDHMRVSQTAVKIKAIVRKKYRSKIPNYVHDIIIHVSDNASHARSMDNFVSLELKRK